MGYRLSDTKTITVAFILQQFYQQNSKQIEALVTENGPASSQVQIQSLWSSFKKQIENEDPNDAVAIAEAAEKMQVLDACIGIAPIIVESGVNSYDFSLKTIKMQLQLWRQLLSFPEMSAVTRASYKSRLLQSPGILSLKDGAVLIYPCCHGDSRPFLVEKDNRYLPEEIETFIDLAKELQKKSTINLIEIARFFLDFTDKIQQKVLEFYAENQPKSLDELQEVADEIAAQYTTPLNIKLDTSTPLMQASKQLCTQLVGNMFKVAQADESSVTIENFFNDIKNKLNLLISGGLIEEKYGFFKSTPDEIICNCFCEEFPGLLKAMGALKRMPAKCFEISDQLPDEEILIQFYSLNGEILKEIDKINFPLELYEYVLYRLWDNFVDDDSCPNFIKNKPELREKISEIDESLQKIIFNCHLKEVIHKERATGVNKEFAQAVEAVAIMWRYPEILSSLAIDISDFRIAVTTMRQRPQNVENILQFYDNNFKTSEWMNKNPSDRINMLHKITLEFLPFIDDIKMLGRFFNKGSVTRIARLAVSGNVMNIVRELLEKMRKEAWASKLEQVFIECVKKVILAAIDDFKNIFPDISVFKNHLPPFAVSQEKGNALNVQQLIPGLILFEIFGLDNFFWEDSRPSGSLNYWAVTVLTGKAISHFMKKFSMKKLKNFDIAIYDNLERYVQSVIQDDALPTKKYAEVFSDLDQNFSTFIYDIFFRLWTNVDNSPLSFAETLILRRSIDLVPTLNSYLIEKAQDENNLGRLINTINNCDHKFFLQIIKEALSFIDDSNSNQAICALVACALKRTPAIDVINVISELLITAAEQDEKPWLSSLTSFLPRRNQEAPSTIFSDGEGSDEQSSPLSPFRSTSLLRSSGYVYEQKLAQTFNKIKFKVKPLFTNILNSDLSLVHRVKLIGALARGKSQRLRLWVDLDLKKIYRALKIFYYVENNETLENYFFTFEKKMQLTDSPEESAQEQSILTDEINQTISALITDLGSFEKLVKIFNACFLSSLSAENPVKYFHEAVNAYMKKMEECEVDIKNALMLRHFYLIFFPENSWKRAHETSESNIFFAPFSAELFRSNKYKNLVICLEQSLPTNKLNYLFKTKNFLANLVTELQSSNDIKSALIICAWMTILRHNSVYACNEIEYIHDQIQQKFVESGDALAEMHEFWLSYKNFDPRKVDTRDVISEMIKQLIVIRENTSEKYGNKEVRYAYWNKYLADLQNVEKISNTKKELCQFAFSRTETEKFAEKDSILSALIIITPDSFLSQLLEGLQEVRELAGDSSYHVLIPHLMEHLFIGFNVIYQYITNPDNAIQEAPAIKRSWLSCIRVIEDIAKFEYLSHAKQYSIFSKTWDRIINSIFAQNLNAKLHDLVLAYDVCLMFEKEGFDQDDAIGVITKNWADITGYSIHAADVSSLRFILDPLMEDFFKSSVEQIQQFDGVLVVKVRFSKKSSWLNTGDSSDLHQKTLLLQEIYKARLQDWYNREPESSMPMNYPVAFIYQPDAKKTELKCVEIYEKCHKNNAIVKNDSSIYASYLLARAARCVSEERVTDSIEEILSDLKKRHQLTNASLEVRFNVEFFDAVLMLVREAMQAMRECYVGIKPITGAFLNPGNMYDDPRVLLRCKPDTLIGFCIIACLCRHLREKRDDAYSQIAGLLSYVEDFFSVRERVTVLGEAHGVTKSKIIERAPAYLKPSDLLKIDSELLFGAEGESKDRQQACVKWWFKSSSAQNEDRPQSLANILEL